MCVTAERLDKELRETFLLTDSLATVKTEIEHNDEHYTDFEDVVLNSGAIECVENFVDPAKERRAGLVNRNVIDLFPTSTDDDFNFDMDDCSDDNDSGEEDYYANNKELKHKCTVCDKILR